MAKIEEVKLLNITLEDDQEYSIQIPEDPKKATVFINGKKIPITTLKQIMDAFIDRYAFAFADPTNDE